MRKERTGCRELSKFGVSRKFGAIGADNTPEKLCMSKREQQVEQKL